MYFWDGFVDSLVSGLESFPGLRNSSHSGVEMLEFHAFRGLWGESSV